MFIMHALRGLGRAAAQPRLAALLWLANLVPAAIVGFPVFVHLRASLATAPEADLLLDGPSLGLLSELAREGRGFSATVNQLLLAAAALALLCNALTAGGTLEALTSRDERPLGHRFGRGAGRFFGRFVRAGIAAGLLSLFVLGLLAAVLRAASRPFEDSPWEPMPLTLAAIRLLLLGAALVVVLMALDLARVRIVKQDAHKTLRLFLASFFLVLRHPVRLLGLWAVNGLFLLALLAAYFAYCGAVPAKTGPAIAALFLVQQLVMLGRAGLRVGLYAGEIATWEGLAPALAPPAQESPATGETAEPAPARDASVAAPALEPAGGAHGDDR
jgi:hypothetical protein